MTPRTKHVRVKHFWFRKVGPGAGINVIKVNKKSSSHSPNDCQSSSLRSFQGVSQDVALWITSLLVRHWFENMKHSTLVGESQDSRRNTHLGSFHSPDRLIYVRGIRDPNAYKHCAPPAMHSAGCSQTF
jgi:hypothetical protein